MRPNLRPPAPSGTGLKKPPGREARQCKGFQNGAKRTRTADPLHAMQVLYQLSYGPIDVTSRTDHF